MSLKDDFLEALKSVKSDIFKDSEYTNLKQRTMEHDEVAAPQEPAVEIIAPRKHIAAFDDEGVAGPPAQPDDVVFEAFKQASTIAEAEDTDDEDEDGDIHSGEGVYSDVDTTPYRSFEAPIVSADNATGTSYGDGRRIYDFDSKDMYSDDKTVISKNTVIRGALQTEDSVRLLGQILGDIDCKSNIVVAGKIRGNTTAANAYIIDAQVDGSVVCDDAINISNDAWVLGNIRAQQAEVDGKIKGNLEIRHTISIGATSSVIGNISTDELEIKRGAFINGQIMMYTPSRDVLDRFDHFEK